MKISPVFLGGLICAIPAFAASANVYSGNGASGFSGSVGNGVLTITANTTAKTITFSEAASGGNFGSGNALVLYIDSQAGGFADTSTFTDNNDVERVAVSGYDLNNPNNGNVTSRTVATFPTGFTADYAIAFDAANANAYTLSTGTFPFLVNAPQTGASPFAITLSYANLGLPATNGTFKFVGTLISESAYRSGETIGAASDSTGSLAGTTRNPGFNGAITFTGSDAFAVPEPSSILEIGFGSLALAVLLAWRARVSA